jgi:uncharacterized membrane protein YcaP (DUF421 family)
VVRGAAVYLILLVIMRLSGRRTMAEVTVFDFVLLLIVAETTQQALLGNDFSITNAVVLIVTLIGLDILMSYLKQWFPMAAKFLEGGPTVLVRNGEPDRHAMKRARVDDNDVMAAARAKHGLRNLSEVEHAVLETDSGISIIPRTR